MELHTIPARSAVTMTVWKLPENTCTSGSHMIPERSVAVTTEKKLPKTPFKWVPYEAPHNANGFAVVMVIV